MMSKTELMFATDVARLIQFVRNQRIILDADLAGLYGVPTKRLNKQFRRDLNRFPADFAFQLAFCSCTERANPCLSGCVPKPEVATTGCDLPMLV